MIFRLEQLSVFVLLSAMGDRGDFSVHIEEYSSSLFPKHSPIKAKKETHTVNSSCMVMQI